MDLKQLLGHSSHVNKVIFSPDSNFLVSAGFSGELYLWDVQKEERLQVYEGHRQTVNGVCWVEKGQELLSASGDGTILRHAISKAAPEQQLQDLKSGVGSIHVTFDENYLLTSNKSNMLTIRELPDGDIIGKLKSDQKSASVLTTANNQNHCMIGGLGSKLRRLDIPSSEVVEELEGHDTATMGFRFFDYDYHAVSVGYEGQMLIWDMVTHQVIEKFHVGDDGYYGLDVSPDGKEVSVTMPYRMKRINLEDLSVQAIDLPAKGNYSVDYSPDGHRIAIGSADKKVRVLTIEGT